MAQEPTVVSSVTQSNHAHYMKVYCDNCKKYSKAKEVYKTSTTTENLKHNINWFLVILLGLIPFPMPIIWGFMYYKKQKSKPTVRSDSHTDTIYCCGFCELPDYVTECQSFNWDIKPSPNNAVSNTGRATTKRNVVNDEI